MVRDLVLIGIVAVLGIFLAGCSSDAPASLPTPEGVSSVDPFFREYYNSLGGSEQLGPAISVRFEKNDQQCQFTIRALLCRDLTRPDSSGYYLFPLGEYLKISDQPDGTNGSAGELNGFVIYPDFYRAYQQMNGVQVAGQPISRVRYNVERKRVEQYFDRVGFYQNFSDPQGSVHLLPYGAYLCGAMCRATSLHTEDFVPGKSDISASFAAYLQMTHTYSIIGRALEEPFKTADGRIEQVFENAVLSAPADQPSKVAFLPIPNLLEIVVEKPHLLAAAMDKNMAFYAVKGELGFEVPLIFVDYLKQHGSISSSGLPISSIHRSPEDASVARQCFKAYCLDYHLNAKADQRIRLSPLGQMYMQKTRPKSVPTTITYQRRDLDISVSEGAPQIAANKIQKISLTLTSKKSGLPLEDVSAELLVSPPDGRESLHYLLPTTDANGESTVDVQAFPDLPNSSVIAYIVCVDLPATEKLCTVESYLIWDLH